LSHFEGEAGQAFANGELVSENVFEKASVKSSQEITCGAKNVKFQIL
jgi:hypothetical protein